MKIQKIISKRRIPVCDMLKKLVQNEMKQVSHHYHKKYSSFGLVISSLDFFFSNYLWENNLNRKLGSPIFHRH